MRRVAKTIAVALLLAFAVGSIVSCQNSDHVVKTPLPPEPKPTN